jgi:hypothetical protein
MLRSCQNVGIELLLVTALLLPAGEIAAQAAPGASANPVHKSKHVSKKQAPVVEAPQPPPVPPTLEQQPPEPPQVTYRDGQLTITSTNATLAQVLRLVQTQTGAAIDVPPGGGSERVVATLGPGKPQNVLATLLNGSKFNYVILGVPNNPGAVQKVILLTKSSASASQAPVSTAQVNPHPQPAVEPQEDEYPQNEPEVENQSQAVLPGADNPSPDGQPGNRTPEQMLQDLQRMQQQQQQMQQQLNPANQQQPFGQSFNPSAPQQPLHSQPAQPPQQPE